MARDKKLREVLDSLSGDPARTLPTPDRELMESVLRRLKIQENRRLAPHEQPAELDAAQEEARMNEEAMQALREKQEHDSEEMLRLQDERERLLEHQRELEERLARLEAASHGGPLSYVDEPETVEFSRVDLDEGEEELLEFQYLGEGERQAPQADAWEEEPAADRGADWGDWPQAEEGASAVSWDDEEEVAWQPEQEDPSTPRPAWEEPGEAAWESETEEPGTAEETPPWSQPASEKAWPQQETPAPQAPGPSPAPTADENLDDLDDRTRAELEELESQLADLEREIEKRGEKDRSESEEDTA